MALLKALARAVPLIFFCSFVYAGTFCPSGPEGEQTTYVYNFNSGRYDCITILSTNTVQAGTNVTVTTNSNGVVINSSGGGGSTVLASSAIAFGSPTNTVTGYRDAASMGLEAFGTYEVNLGSNPFPNAGYFGTGASLNLWQQSFGGGLDYGPNLVLISSDNTTGHQFMEAENGDIVNDPTDMSIFEESLSPLGKVTFFSSQFSNSGSYYFGGDVAAGHDPNYFSMDASSDTLRRNTKVLGNLTVTGTCTGCGSGGGAGYALQPATVTVLLNGGLTASTGTFTSSVTVTGSGGITNTYGIQTSTINVSSNTIVPGMSCYQDGQCFMQSLTEGTSSWVYGSSGTWTPNAVNSNIFSIVLHSSVTVAAPSNAQDGQRYLYRILQDVAGSRNIFMDASMHFGTDVSSVTFTSTASKTDYMACIYDAANTACDIIAPVMRGY